MYIKYNYRINEYNTYFTSWQVKTWPLWERQWWISQAVSIYLFLYAITHRPHNGRSKSHGPLYINWLLILYSVDHRPQHRRKLIPPTGIQHWSNPKNMSQMAIQIITGSLSLLTAPRGHLQRTCDLHYDNPSQYSTLRIKPVLTQVNGMGIPHILWLACTTYPNITTGTARCTTNSRTPTTEQYTRPGTRRLGPSSLHDLWLQLGNITLITLTLKPQQAIRSQNF